MTLTANRTLLQYEPSIQIEDIVIELWQETSSALSMLRTPWLEKEYKRLKPPAASGWGAIGGVESLTYGDTPVSKVIQTLVKGPTHREWLDDLGESLAIPMGRSLQPVRVFVVDATVDIDMVYGREMDRQTSLHIQPCVHLDERVFSGLFWAPTQQVLVLIPESCRIKDLPKPETSKRLPEAIRFSWTQTLQHELTHAADIGHKGSSHKVFGKKPREVRAVASEVIGAALEWFRKNAGSRKYNKMSQAERIAAAVAPSIHLRMLDPKQQNIAMQYLYTALLKEGYVS